MILLLSFIKSDIYLSSPIIGYKKIVLTEFNYKNEFTSYPNLKKNSFLKAIKKTFAALDF